jgi:hypothetical protein
MLYPVGLLSILGTSDTPTIAGMRLAVDETSVVSQLRVVSPSIEQQGHIAVIGAGGTKP